MSPRLAAIKIQRQQLLSWVLCIESAGLHHRADHGNLTAGPQTSDYYVISEETNCNCCTAAYLFTYRCLLLPIICLALFYGQFLSLWSVIFKATNAKPQLALFRVTNIWRNATLPAVRCRSFTFYKVVW